MARKSLVSLLPTTPQPADTAQSDEPTSQEGPTPVLAVVRDAPIPAEPAAETHQDEAPARTAKRTKTPEPVDERVHYAQLIRKEARLRDDQIDDLATRARKLSRARTGTDVRITDNTLIRVAVDLLLSRSDQLKGNTEAELRKSVGL